MTTFCEEELELTGSQAFPVPITSRCDSGSDTVHYSVLHSVLRSSGIGISHADKEDLRPSTESDPRYDGSPVSHSFVTWFGRLSLAGIGMFVEAYIIISIGQLRSVWHVEYPTCWSANNEQLCPQHIECDGLFPNTPDDIVPQEICNADGTYPDDMICEESLLGLVGYLEFAGMMLGMLLIGWLMDRIGRKAAGFYCAVCMFIGILVMTFIKSVNLQKQFLIFAAFFFIFGVGVGGEFPLAAANSSESHARAAEEAQLDDEARRIFRLKRSILKVARRGETMSIANAMQGVGAVFGSLVFLVYVYFSRQTYPDCNRTNSNSEGYDRFGLNSIWRSYLFIGTVLVLMILLYREFIVEESKSYEKVKERRKRRQKRLGKSGFLKIVTFYGLRLTGTSVNWALFNVAQYGLKLFSGPIFSDINPDGGLLFTNLMILINNVCFALGFYCSALVVDRKMIGRKRLQLATFLVAAICFFIVAATFNKASTGAILFLYNFATFLMSLGPNNTTKVMAAETYPTELRGTCYGFSAFVGKAGALGGTLAFGFIDTITTFYICGACFLLSAIVTFLFSVDLTAVSLAEHDAQLEMFLSGQVDKYKGILNERNHLSWVEIWTGKHGGYDENWANKLLEEADLLARTGAGDCERSANSSSGSR